jgi:copper chaperone CopZ
MTKLTLRVMNMECPNCAMRLEGLEDLLAGVKRITASYHKQEMVVEFDEKIISLEAIIQAVKNEGYEAILK